MPAVSIASPFIGPVRKRATNSFGTDGRLATSRDTFFALLSIIRSFAFVMPRTQNYGQAPALCRWARRTSLGIAGIGRLEHHVGELLAYLERNQGALVHYAARRRNGEPISTAFVESSVNEIIAKRMNKKQQMRWNRATVQPFLDVRTAVLNDTLEDAFRR